MLYSQSQGLESEHLWEAMVLPSAGIDIFFLMIENGLWFGKLLYTIFLDRLNHNFAPMIFFFLCILHGGRFELSVIK